MLPIGIEVRARAVRPFPTSSKISKFPLILGSVEFGFNGPGMILYILNCYSFRTWEGRCFCLRLICLPSKLFNTLLKYQQLLLLLKGFTHMQNCCEIFLDFLGLVWFAEQLKCLGEAHCGRLKMFHSCLDRCLWHISSFTRYCFNFTWQVPILWWTRNTCCENLEEVLLSSRNLLTLGEDTFWSPQWHLPTFWTPSMRCP